MSHFSRKLLHRAAIALFLAAALVSSNAHAQSDLEKTKARAIQLTKEQKFVDALPLLERLSIDSPEDAEVFFYLGFALLGKANTISDPQEKTTLRVRSRKAFIKSRELGNREPLVESLIAGLPADGSAGGAVSTNKEAERLLHEGEAYYAQGKLDDSLRSYEKALKLDPNLYEAALFSGDIYVVRNDFRKAEESYQRAIAINPARETAYRYSATPFMKQKKFAEARERYIEAYITEPYNRFASGGLTQWSNVTGTAIGHPEIEFPEKIEVDADGRVTVDIGPGALLGGRDNGTFYWSLYAPVRNRWQKEAFLKAYPNETRYRHSLAEEVEAVRAVLNAVRSEKSIKKLDPSLEKLIKLDDQGLLESYILLSRPDEGIAADHPTYLKQNREKLRRYVSEYVVGTERAPVRSNESEQRSESKSSGLVERTYSASADETSVKIGLAPITCVKDGCVFFSVETSFAGKKAPAKLGRITFALVIFTKSLKAESDPRLLIRIDGKVHDLGKAQFVSEESRDGLRGLIYATVLRDEELSAIAGAKSVDVNLGTFQFSLSERSIKALAEFYNSAKLGQ